MRLRRGRRAPLRRPRRPEQRSRGAWRLAPPPRAVLQGADPPTGGHAVSKPGTPVHLPALHHMLAGACVPDQPRTPRLGEVATERPEAQHRAAPQEPRTCRSAGGRCRARRERDTSGLRLLALSREAGAAHRSLAVRTAARRTRRPAHSRFITDLRSVERRLACSADPPSTGDAARHDEITEAALGFDLATAQDVAELLLPHVAPARRE